MILFCENVCAAQSLRTSLSGEIGRRLKELMVRENTVSPKRKDAQNA